MSFNADLQALYERINARSTPIAQTELNGPITYCKAIWTFGEFELTSAFNDLNIEMSALRHKGARFGCGILNLGQLHWTLFQLKTFPQTPELMSLEGDAEKLQRILYETPHFTVTFRGISKTRFGLFLNGYPSINVNAVRDKIRGAFPDAVEPHPQDICHATLFRFTSKPTAEDHALLDQLVEKYRNVTLATLTPDVWNVGYGTWLQRIHTAVSFYAVPRWILHRGLKAGPNPALENEESELWARIQEGWDVEVDVWVQDGVFWLGHDRPTTILKNMGLLLSPKVWIHAKNLEAVAALPSYTHYFVHDKDPATLTSKGVIWCYPGNCVEKKPAVIVLPERVGFKFPMLANYSAVCSDFLPSAFIE
jgi:hypothetical protein